MFIKVVKMAAVAVASFAVGASIHAAVRTCADIREVEADRDEDLRNDEKLSLFVTVMKFKFNTNPVLVIVKNTALAVLHVIGKLYAFREAASMLVLVSYGLGLPFITTAMFKGALILLALSVAFSLIENIRNSLEHKTSVTTGIFNAVKEYVVDLYEYRVHLSLAVLTCAYLGASFVTPQMILISQATLLVYLVSLVIFPTLRTKECEESVSPSL